MCTVRVGVAVAPLVALVWDVRALRAYLRPRPRARAALSALAGYDMAHRLLDAQAAAEAAAVAAVAAAVAARGSGGGGDA